MDTWERLGVFDLETTGLNVTTSRIVTAFVGVLDSSGAVIESHEWVADPGVDIPDAAANVHGYTTERARAEGRPASDVVSEIVERLRVLLSAGTPVVAYNASYDFSLLHHDAIRHQVEPLAGPRPLIDPLVIDKKVDTFRKGSRTLQAACDLYGVDLGAAHESQADAVAAGRVFLAIREKFAGSPELALTPSELHDAQVLWAKAQSDSFAKYLASKGETSRRPGDGIWPVFAG
ncbi:MAG: exonuclease domain-containing protein [Microbacteriaceae bacterium]|nr:exonuclease domain-containing protein [Microbacteriaceae bacterium]